MKASYIKKKFFETIDSIVADPSPFVKRPGSDFTRTRLCPLRELVTFLLTMEAGTLNREIRRFFFKPASSKKQPITKAAIIQQRDKLNDTFFPFVFSAVNKIRPFTKTLNGFHLLACDGSDLDIPAYKDDKETYVASNTEDVGYHQFHLNAIYDVLEQRYVDVSIQPRGEINERSALVDFIRQTSLPEKSIFIADRGYFSLNVLAHISVSKYHYVLRMNSDEASRAFIRRFNLPESDEFDVILDFDVTRSYKKCYTKKPDKFVCLKPDRPFDFIPTDDKKSMFHVRTRLVKIKLSKGNYEFLFTDLPHDFGLEALKHVYHLRWGIETSFSHLKYNMALNSFHSKRRDFICQEIYARMILFNLTMLMVHCVNLPQRDCLLEYKVSISDAVITCRDYLHNRMSNDTVALLLIDNVTPIREGRTYPRKKHTKRVVPLNYRA